MKAPESSHEPMQKPWRSGSREAIVAAAERLFLEQRLWRGQHG